MSKIGHSRWQYDYPPLKLTYYFGTKSGGTSICQALGVHCSVVNNKWVDLKEPFKKNSGWFSATSCRNPLDRLVSAFHSAQNPDCGPSSYFLHHELGLKGNKCTFTNFIHAITEHKPHNLNWHIIPQTHLSPEDVDYVIRYEHLQEDWANLGSKFNIGELPHKNQSQHEPYMTYYTKETYDIVVEYYNCDFVRFGYEL